MNQFSLHATKRAQGRSISPVIIEWLIECGTSYEAGAGAQKLIFDKPARRRLQKKLGTRIYTRVEDSLNAYIVCGAAGSIITCGWLTSRVHR